MFSNATGGFVQETYKNSCNFCFTIPKANQINWYVPIEN